MHRAVHDCHARARLHAHRRDGLDEMGIGIVRALGLGGPSDIGLDDHVHSLLHEALDAAELGHAGPHHPLDGGLRKIAAPHDNNGVRGPRGVRRAFRRCRFREQRANRSDNIGQGDCAKGKKRVFDEFPSEHLFHEILRHMQNPHMIAHIEENAIK